jgi:hypothetical protein
MVMQMLGGQGGGAGNANNLGALLGGQGGRGGRLAGRQLGGGNLGALMNNPQVMQMLQQMLAGQGARGGALARNAPAPPPAAALSTDLTATFGVRVGDASGERGLENRRPHRVRQRQAGGQRRRIERRAGSKRTDGQPRCATPRRRHNFVSEEMILRRATPWRVADFSLAAGGARALF